MATTVVSKVTQIEVKKFKPYTRSRYAPHNREEYDVKLYVTLEDGHSFYSPATSMTITSVSGAAVMTTIENDWITGGNGVLKQGHNDCYPESKIEVGREITIRATEKGGRLTRVKLISVSPEENQETEIEMSKMTKEQAQQWWDEQQKKRDQRNANFKAPPSESMDADWVAQDQRERKEKAQQEVERRVAEMKKRMGK